MLTNPVMNWWWSHINYQQVHHRYPYLSHRYLPQIYEATKDEQPYAVVQGYWQCLFHLTKMKYYSSQEEIEPFLAQSQSFAEIWPMKPPRCKQRGIRIKKD